LKQHDIEQEQPGITREKFLYNLSSASYEKKWGRNYRRPNFAERFYAFLFRLIPKIGPLKILTFRTPTPETEKLFEASFNATLDRYRHLLDQVAAGTLQLPNDNFDTGDATPLGIYHLADAAYANLLQRLAQSNFATADQKLRADILQFYATLPKHDPANPAQDPNPSSAKLRARVRRALAQLKSAPPAVPAAE
jgi:hypothetical protein